MELDLQLLEFCKEKHWPDRCNHPESAYIGSFVSFCNEKIDLYVFDTPTHENPQGLQQVCMRYGESDAEYAGYPSTRSLLEVAILNRRNSDYVEDAVRVLDALGTFKWHKKEET